MASNACARKRSERGAAALEFGLIAPILFLLLFGIIQFGLWFWSWQIGAQAAREVARVAAVDPCNESKLQSTGTDRLAGAPSAGTTAITVDRPTPLKIGEDITVHVSFRTVDLGLFPGFDGVIEKSATTRIEYIPVGGGTC